MKEKKSQLSSFNVFSFKTEAEMIVWIKFWEKHADDYFKRFSPFGLVKITFNQVWNKKNVFKTSTYFEYESPEAFKKIQKEMETWRKDVNDDYKFSPIIDATRNIILQQFE